MAVKSSKLKRAYVTVAQALPGWVASEHMLRSAARLPHGWRRWVASLGAIYHPGRMIALDIPWWNVEATVLVEQFLGDRPDSSVFEYGAGASTVWLARRAASVLSVEHDAEWASQVSGFLRGFSHARLTIAELDSRGSSSEQPYVEAIKITGHHDLIVIDGRMRAACLKAAIPHLKPDGILLFDDSGRRRYRRAIRESGLVERRLFGLSYCVPYPDSTSMLTHPPAHESLSG